MTAEFPELNVENETSPSSNTDTQIPDPIVTLTRELQPGGDFAYVDGLHPDRQELYTWTWDTESGTPTAEGTYNPSVTIGAQSASAAARSHDAEFLSGILFGVGAGALTAAIQEFMTSARRKSES
jgi:hypothetical protein